MKGSTCFQSLSWLKVHFSYGNPAVAHSANPNDRIWPELPTGLATRTLPLQAAAPSKGRPPPAPSDFRLLGYFEGVIDLDAEVPHCRLQLGMPEQQLHGAQVLGPPIDQRRLGPSHRMRPVVGRV